MPDTYPDTLLGFDFGLRKIGVAVGQRITCTANPLSPLKAESGIPDWDTIQALIDTWHIRGFVVGIPLNLDGTDQAITLAARKFARRLNGRFHLPVYLVDERYTTKAARAYLRDNPLDQKKTTVDSYAAKIILESWLSSIEEE